MFGVYFLFILVLINYSFSEDRDYLIERSSEEELIIEYRPILLRVDTIYVGGKSYISFYFLNGGNLFDEPGRPHIPARFFTLGLKSENGNQVEVIQVTYRDYHGVLFKPMPYFVPDAGDSVLFIREYIEGDDYVRDQFIPEKIAEIIDTGISRSYIVGVLRVVPVQYNPARRVARIYTRIKIRVRYASEDGLRFSKPDRFDASIYSSFVNEEIARNWKLVSGGVSKRSRSQLATGQWFRIPITSEGIYKITYSALRDAGINPADIDPRTIKIYNNGGYQLPEPVTESRPDGLIENAIYVYGEGDGRFDPGDYILFYGKGTDGWRYDPDDKKFYHYINDYTDVNYYFLTFGGEFGKRVQLVSHQDMTPVFRPGSTLGMYFKEEQRINLTGSGRDWMMTLVRSGDMVSYAVKLNGLVPGSTVRYRVQVASRSPVSNRFIVYEHDYELGSIKMGTVSLSGYLGIVGYYARKSSIVEFAFSGNLSDSRSVLKFYYESSSSIAEGYVKWFEILYQREFRAVDDYFAFYSYDTTGVVEYKISGFSSNDIKVFEVSDFTNVRMVDGDANAGEFMFKFNQEGGIYRFIAVGPNGIREVGKIEKVRNSNLRGVTEGADFVIISHPDFISQAERLKEHRERMDGLKTMVVNVEDIYNEFSCGMLDPVAIRDFLKFAFDNWRRKPFYVLLFGDGDYDYRNVEAEDGNWIPPYESRESFYQIKTYCSDDFFVLLTPDRIIDMSIGRLPVRTSDEADIVVDKIIQYETSADFSSWRDVVLFVADDGLTVGSNTDGVIHTWQSEILANNHTPDYIDKQKIYLVAFPTVYTSIGRRKPDAAKALIDYINRGVAVVNWIGHGNPYVWAHEKVFDIGYTIPNLKNSSKLPFIIAATCDFGRFDMPTDQSSTEVMLVKPDAGVIGVLTATRIVYSGDNAAFNYKFFDELFKSTREHKTVRFGEAMFKVKQVYNALNDLKFHLFVDPTLRLIIPRYTAVIDSINSIDARNNVVQLKALERVILRGRIVKNTGEDIPKFSGVAEVILYDARKDMAVRDELNTVFEFNLQGDLLFRGQYTISNGRFKPEFIIPKDIAYSDLNAKLIVYFHNESVDGVGHVGNIRINGINPNFKGDSKGPEIQIYLNNRSFRSGDIVNDEPVLIVDLFDESGINISTVSIGHRVEAWLDDNAIGFDLTKYFKGKLDDYRSGEIIYRLPKLSPGKHKLKVKAWDVVNNSSTAEVEFNVAGVEKLLISDVFNYPNPFSDRTYFTFRKIGTVDDLPIDVEIKIYTVSGKLINRIERFGLTGNFVSIEWDGRDFNGDEIANGVYIYKVIVRSVDGDQQVEAIGKLVVMR